MINLQIGARRGTLCAREPAVPAKLCQDVTKLGFILVPSYCVCLAPSPCGTVYVLGGRPGGVVTSGRGETFGVVPGPLQVGPDLLKVEQLPRFTENVCVSWVTSPRDERSVCVPDAGLRVTPRLPSTPTSRVLLPTRSPPHDLRGLRS